MSGRKTRHHDKISENIAFEEKDSFDINNPPSGALIKTEMNSLVIGATTRSPIAFFLVPFMIVWSGGSLGGIYGTQILSGEFNPFISLFGIPFLIGSVIFWSFALMAVAGKVELVLDKNGGKVFTGVGKLGLTQKFLWEDVTTIKEGQSKLNYPGGQGGIIQLEGKKRISFGSGLNESRLYYIFKAVSLTFKKQKSRKLSV